MIVGGTARTFRRGQAGWSVSGKSGPRRPSAITRREGRRLIGWDASGQWMFSIGSDGRPIRWLVRRERAFGF